MSESKIKLSDFLKNYLAWKRVTQSQFAIKTGVRHSSLHAYVHGVKLRAFK